MALVLFPSQPFRVTQTDLDFVAEAIAARDAGFETALVDHTRLAASDMAGALAAVPRGAGSAIYRGWMLSAEQYRAAHEALAAEGVFLVNSPTAYETCHHLPSSYALIEEHTARSVWLPLAGPLDFDAIMRVLLPFGDGPVVLKDYVKSQKHYWLEACFIPSASDADAVQRVVTRFLELQGEDLNIGLVFREYLPLKILGAHPESGMPMAAESRTFWFDGELLMSHRYWGELTTFDSPLPVESLRRMARRVPSRFFSMDVAFLDDGGWIIVELGDGQVAGLPTPTVASEFFARLKAVWHEA